MRCTTPGTSDASFSSAAFSQGVSQTTIDKELQWINLGSAVRLNAHSYSPWTSSYGHSFSCIKDSLGGAGGAGNLQVCIGSLVNGAVVLGGKGTTGLNPPASWASTYGQQTIDGFVLAVTPAGYQTQFIICLRRDLLRQFRLQVSVGHKLLKGLPRLFNSSIILDFPKHLDRHHGIMRRMLLQPTIRSRG